MIFSDTDAGESLLGMSVEKMGAEELLPYCIAMHKDILGFKPAIDLHKDKAVLRWLRKTYGEDAGRIVKWTFFKYNGEVDGETFAVTWFNRGHKWWIDQMYSEMKLATTQRARIQPTGFMSAKDLFRAAAVAS